MTELGLIGIVGSLRAHSVNGATARAAATAAPTGISLALHDVSDVPLYNGDTEDAGPPTSVVALNEAVEAADGLVLFSPEYNLSFPAVTKNVIDWLSRPPRAWQGTPVALITTSPGPRAGLSLREHFSAIMARQPIRLFETHGIGQYGEKLDGKGELVDEETLAQLTGYLDRFGRFCRQPADEAGEA